MTGKRTLKLPSGEYERPMSQKESCAICRFSYRMPNKALLCRRYPASQKVEDAAWCGEFQVIFGSPSWTNKKENS